MITKGSRYATAGTFTPDESRFFQFEGIRPREIGPATGVLEHVVKEDERLDLLALYYYNDPRKWWRILDANPEILNGGDLFIAGGSKEEENPLKSLVGSVILIPRVSEVK